MTGEDNYWATLLACAEMARYGTVSFSDVGMLCSFLMNLVELDDLGLACADINGDGTIDFMDVSALIYVIVNQV